MEKIEFKNYGLRASVKGLSPTEIGGRYSSQASAEKRIIMDITKKLDIQPEDRFLDIGCGPGLTLIPVSYMCSSSSGIDHPEVIKYLRKRIGQCEINLIGGNFLEISLNEFFDKILIYGVLQTLSDQDEVLDFISRALDLLMPGGRLLLGDISNISKKKRFQLSGFGKRFEKNWDSNNGFEKNEKKAQFPGDQKIVTFDDNLVLDMIMFIRKKGLDAYILPQPSNLPFGFTREDILVIKPSE